MITMEMMVVVTVGDQGDDADDDNDYYAVDGEADTYEVGVVTGEILLQQQILFGS